LTALLLIDEGPAMRSAGNRARSRSVKVR